MEYVGISVQTSDSVQFKLIDVRAKVNFVQKYLWIFIISGCCVLLIFVAIVMLISTAPAKPIFKQRDPR